MYPSGRPTADARPRPGFRVRPEGAVWLAVAVLLGLVGWYKSINLLLLFAYVMLAVVAVNALVARAHARRAAAARLPALPSHAGRLAPARVTVSNSGPRPVVVQVTDRVAGAACGWLVYRLPAGGDRQLDQPRPPVPRGRHRADPLVVRSGYPFGLVGFTVIQPPAAADELVVLPAPGTADADRLRAWLARRAGGGDRGRRVLRRPTADHADVRGVRPYRPGESIRWVHWRSTARRGEPMVREYDTAPAPDLVLVVDPWLPPNPSAADRDRLEAALSLAAAVVVAWCDGPASRLTVVVAGEPPVVRGGTAGPQLVVPALVALAEVDGLPDVPVPGPEAFPRGLTAAARVVVGTRPASPMAAALGRAAGRPFLVAAPSDPLPWYRPPATGR